VLCGESSSFAAGPTAVADSPADAPNWPKPAPVPFYSAEDAIKTMKLADDRLKIEVVAEEPMVEHPIFMTFDPEGRAWVVEMRSYMPNAEGEGENAPTGRISVLEDTDGDGRMDKCTVFLDNLVLPRALAIVRDGVFVAEPPNLMFCRDTDGDLKCDEKKIIATDYGISGNPEHQPNGLMYGLDNWIYSANYDRRIRWINGTWVSDRMLEFGQWGLSQDNFGRIFHNNNTNQLRGCIVPPQYVLRNPRIRASGGNEQITGDQTVWPLHDTAVDRGYIENIMRADGTLRNFTAACSPFIYRGGLLPSDYDGNAFVAEPAGNLIKRDILSETKEGSVTARNAYDGNEFLASTYERFRPVSFTTGPDGALYVVDMHHGLIQHKVYLTTYCRNQYLQRQLNLHLGTGRIYRIVPKDAKLFPKPNLSNATTTQLVATLEHPNGWWRDTAQRLIVERDDYKAIPLLKKLFADTSKDRLFRLQALWTIEGFGIDNTSGLKAALQDTEPKIRAAAIRMSERPLYSPRRADIVAGVMKLADDRDPEVRRQFVLSIAPLGTPESDAAMVKIVTESAEEPFIVDALISGLTGREYDFLAKLIASPAWASDSPVRHATLKALARCVFEGSAKRIAPLLELIASQAGANEWKQLAMLDGVQTKLDSKRQAKQILLDAEPKTFTALKQSGNADVKEKVKNVLKVVHWPGEPGYVPPPPPKPLTVTEQARFDRGKIVFGQTCIACHKADGLGQEGLAPPLVDSEWVLGRADRVARIVLHGVSGPISVDGKNYSLEMPGLAKLSDEDIASVLTYVRRSWDHTASPVSVETVKEARATNRPIPWTASELLAIGEPPQRQRKSKKQSEKSQKSSSTQEVSQNAQSNESP
jgi:mono/diheme cytochrome c family protein/glucose/arabinose dehydrogenase